jgi:hypothetical protein
MIKRKKLLLLLLLWYQLGKAEAQVQPDTVKTKTTAIQLKETTLKIEPKSKRQRNRTGATVFVSCLFIIATTILLYNVRSK